MSEIRKWLGVGAGVFVAAVAMGGIGCAAAQPKPVSRSVFFPAAPDLARIQYLTSFTGRKDVEEQSSFDKFVAGERPDIKVDKPYGVAIHGGRIYVCDTNAGLIVFDLKAKTFGFMKGAVGNGVLRQATNISIDADGVKYVADPIRAQVVVFDRNDEYVKAIAFEGPWRPVDAVPYGGELFVADTASSVIRVFDLSSGEMVRTMGDKGDPADRLDRPTNLAIDGDGFIYVTDAGRFQVLKFDRDGHFRSTIGQAGDSAGAFARPKGIAVDREGHLLVVDASFANVQVFNKDARILLFFGGSGEKPGDMLLPAKVALDYDNVKYLQPYVDPGFQVQYLILVTNQFGPRRVNVYAYGQEKGKKYPTDAELLRLIEERKKKELEKAPAAPKPVEPAPAKPQGA